MLFLQDVAYAHPNRDLLFSQITLSIHKNQKAALIGNNGTGKSTLLKIMAGQLAPGSGTVHAEAACYYVPQLFGQLNNLTVAEALGIDTRLHALRRILAGEVSEENLTILADDWAIEERCEQAFAHWGLKGVGLDQPMQTLSGGQKTKVFLAGILIREPEIVLLDEPSNHLDQAGRDLLYAYIRTTSDTLVVVSHDRYLLNLLDTTYELSRQGITVYGGNYDFYAEQKQTEAEALSQELKSKEKALRKARETERESVERQQKLDARGRKKQEKAGLPAIVMNAFRNNAEKSTSKMKNVHAEKVGNLSQELHKLRTELPEVDKMKMDLDNSALHKGKILLTASQITYSYDDENLWKEPLSFEIVSGERIGMEGKNGSGKTTLVRILLGELQPCSGTITSSIRNAVYIDQDYSLIADERTVYEQVQQFNTGALQEHEIKIRLNRYLFGQAYWDKPCRYLSGGEKMRLMLCSLAVASSAPDVIVLDEPTNNLDIQNIEILTAALNAYEGTLLVISHDRVFREQIRIGRTISLD